MEINDKDNLILELNNEIREKDDHIGLLEKKLHKYKTKLKKPESILIQPMKNSPSSNTRNFSAPSPRLSNNQMTIRKNKFSVNEFAFETEIASDSEMHHAIDGSSRNITADNDILDSSISSIVD